MFNDKVITILLSETVKLRVLGLIYKFILLNAVLCNTFECLLTAQSVYDSFIKDGSIFCPALNENKIGFNWLRMIIYSSGKLFKTCSILSSLLFSIERYLNLLNCANKKNRGHKRRWGRFWDFEVWVLRMYVSTHMHTCIHTHIHNIES